MTYESKVKPPTKVFLDVGYAVLNILIQVYLPDCTNVLRHMYNIKIMCDFLFMYNKNNGRYNSVWTGYIASFSFQGMLASKTVFDLR